MAAGDHRIPAVAVLAVRRDSAARQSSSSAQLAARPSAQRQTVSVPTTYTVLPSADSRATDGSGSVQRRAPRHQRRRVEQDELGGLALIEIEVLDRERPVAEHDERVVRTRARARRRYASGARSATADGSGCRDDVAAIRWRGRRVRPARTGRRRDPASDLWLRASAGRAARPKHVLASRSGWRADRVAQHEQLPGSRRTNIVVAYASRWAARRQPLARPDLQRPIPARAGRGAVHRPRPAIGSATAAARCSRAQARAGDQPRIRQSGGAVPVDPRGTPGSLVISRNACRDGYCTASTMSHSS